MIAHLVQDNQYVAAGVLFNIFLQSRQHTHVPALRVAHRIGGGLPEILVRDASGHPLGAGVVVPPQDIYARVFEYIQQVFRGCLIPVIAVSPVIHGEHTGHRCRRGSAAGPCVGKTGDIQLFQQRISVPAVAVQREMISPCRLTDNQDDQFTVLVQRRYPCILANSSESDGSTAVFFIEVSAQRINVICRIRVEPQRLVYAEKGGVKTAKYQDDDHNYQEGNHDRLQFSKQRLFQGYPCHPGPAHD